MLTPGQQSSPYDLHFRLLGFPVQVQGIFWLLALITGYSTLNLGFEYFFAWVAILFGSILLHEMGHGLAFRYFGVRSRLMLTGFGGLAIPDGHVPGVGQRILVSLAGPAIQLALYGILYAFRTDLLLLVASPVWFFFLLQLMFVNLVWPILNLMPIWPLDGGQVSREVCVRANWRNGELISLQIGIAVALSVVAWALANQFKLIPLDVQENYPWWLPTGGIFTMVLFGYLAAMNFQRYQEVRDQSRWRNDPY